MKAQYGSVPNEQCCGAAMEKVFRGETKRFRGWYCPCCSNWRPAIGRELLYGMEYDNED
jgi:hypothetical protein